jgi:hypothetical protein
MEGGLILVSAAGGEIVVGSVTGNVRLLLRLEGLCLLVVGVLAYARFGDGWGVFALFFLAPDVSFLGYLAGPRVGAASYNIAHSLIGALAALAAGVLLSVPLAVTVGLVWMAHIGFDRALGYGLKYSSGFGFTHLGFIGRQRSGVQGKMSRRRAVVDSGARPNNPGV